MNRTNNIDVVSLAELLCNEASSTTGVYLRGTLGLIVHTKNIPPEFCRRKMECYRTSDYQLVWIRDGSATINCNMRRMDIQKGDLLVLTPGVLLVNEWSSPDYDAGVVSLNENLSDCPTPFSFGLLHPEETTLHLIWDYFNFIEKLIVPESCSKEAIRAMVISALHYAASTSRDGCADVAASSDRRKQALYDSFIHLLNHHGKREHRTSFYADKLHLSPNYLNSIIKETSGKTIYQWINHKLVFEAKAALSHSSMTVQELSEKLNFPNPAFFCRFFKRHTGLRPSEYRNSK